MYNFGRPFLGHYYFILSLSDPCPGVKKKILKGIMHFHYMHTNTVILVQCMGVNKKIFKEIMYFHYMTYMAKPILRKKTCPGGHEIYNLGRPFLGHHYYILSKEEDF